ncbi:uncharacterized protein LOC109201612 [Oreochromis niloticus]|uniref:uncharacterized protein LOC109201612 n=1 Tax=Oreochromis niloticus TaxID=8128 RepID=UPI0009049BD9|nr:uncharacterized protein LOC109201612 [Oreochromis niloticus]
MNNKDCLPLVWWTLAVGREEMWLAERRLLEETFKERTEEQAWSQRSFLKKFASSPAFSETSMYGSCRFTFTVEEVLKAYSKQFCSGQLPIMRVFKTSLYKKQVMYAVLVHRPNDNNENFKQYPELLDGPNAICAYRDGRFIWRPQAMCGQDRYKLKIDMVNNLADGEGPFQKPYCVWDHVALALHVKSGEVLKFDSDDMRKNLSFCERDQSVPKSATGFDTYEDAQKEITLLWPPKEASLEQSAADLCLEKKRPRDY